MRNSSIWSHDVLTYFWLRQDDGSRFTRRGIPTIRRDQKGVRGKDTFVCRGALRYISMCEARFSASPLLLIIIAQFLKWKLLPLTRSTSRELKQQRRQQQRKHHLKINIWEILTFLRLFLLPCILLWLTEHAANALVEAPFSWSKASYYCVFTLLSTLNLDILRCHLLTTSKNATYVCAARAARLFFLIQPIRSLFSIVVATVAVVLA